MTEHISTLELRWRVRAGSRSPQPGDQTYREYLDFVIDGQSLQDTLDAGGIGRLGWGVNRAYEEGKIRQLLLEQESELETGRRMLYACPECGDIGCGAITIVVEQDDQCIKWKDFGWELNYELDGRPLFDLTEYADIGPFRFDNGQYRDALLNWPPRP